MKKDIEEKNILKRKKIVTLTTIITLGVILIGITLAFWFVIRTQDGENRISALDCLDISLTGNEAINLVAEYPISNEEGMQLTPHSFTLRNECDSNIEVDIILGVLNTSTMSAEHVRVSLHNKGEVSDNSAVLSTHSIVTPTALENATSYELQTKIVLGPNQTIERDLRLWMDQTASFDQTAGNHFSSRIVIVASPLRITVQYRSGFAGEGSGEIINVEIGSLYRIKSPSYIDVSSSQFTFSHWNTHEFGSGSNFVPGQQIRIEGPLIFYAQWVIRD